MRRHNKLTCNVTCRILKRIVEVWTCCYHMDRRAVPLR